MHETGDTANGSGQNFTTKSLSSFDGLFCGKGRLSDVAPDLLASIDCGLMYSSGDHRQIVCPEAIKGMRDVKDRKAFDYFRSCYSQYAEKVEKTVRQSPAQEKRQL